MHSVRRSNLKVGVGAEMPIAGNMIRLMAGRHDRFLRLGVRTRSGELPGGGFALNLFGSTA